MTNDKEQASNEQLVEDFLQSDKKYTNKAVKGAISELIQGLRDQLSKPHDAEETSPQTQIVIDWFIQQSQQGKLRRWDYNTSVMLKELTKYTNKTPINAP